MKSKQMQNHTAKNNNRHWLAQLATDEHAKLIALNDKLIDAEKWILKRAEQPLTASHDAGGFKRHWHTQNLFEDVELEASVVCVMSREHPNYDPDDDNEVARLDASMLFVNDWSDSPFSFAEFGGITNEEPLAGVKLCWLAHDLFDHVLRRDWDKALSIGGLWIDMKLVQRQMLSW